MACILPCKRCGNVLHVYVEEDMEANHFVCPKCGATLARPPAHEITQSEGATALTSDPRQAKPSFSNHVRISHSLAIAARRLRERPDPLYEAAFPALGVLGGFIVGVLLFLLAWKK